VDGCVIPQVKGLRQPSQGERHELGMQAGSKGRVWQFVLAVCLTAVVPLSRARHQASARQQARTTLLSITRGHARTPCLDAMFEGPAVCSMNQSMVRGVGLPVRKILNCAVSSSAPRSATGGADSGENRPNVMCKKGLRHMRRRNEDSPGRQRGNCTGRNSWGCTVADAW